MNLKTQLKTTVSYMSILSSSGINTLQDFFMFFPRGYEDRTNMKNLNEIKFDGSQQSTKWKIIDKNMVFTRTWKKIIQFKFHDVNGAVWHITYMNSQFVYSNTNVDQWYVIMWKPKLDWNKIVFWYPEMIPATQDDDSTQEEYKTWRIYPIYTQLQWINHNWFSKKIWEQLEMIPSIFHEIFPQDFLQEYDLIDYPSMIKNLHYPDSLKDLDRAKYRLYFQKLLRIQLVSLMNKHEYQNWSFVEKKLSTNWDLIKQFLETLPFELTNAQKVSLKQIVDDFHETKPMMRLMQWDVWSGKTVVAVAAAFYIIKRFGWQVALLAPTEVLANQHLLSIGKYLLPLWIRIELITGSTPAKQKEKIKQDLVSGNIQMIVWTHALIQDDVDFQNLQLAIIDEQHKFGVMQRSFFKRFHSPHLLQMTATPIPRSLALAFFGEFDVSIIDQMPAWRKQIITKVVTLDKYEKLRPWLLTKLSQWQNIYIITPLIQESEKLDEVQSVLQEYEDVNVLLSEYKWKIWLLHGKLKSAEKDDVMKKFKKWDYRILVSTTVIEVGVDVPQATIIIIKNSERFGLSQLHQLRGRVGRSDLQSYCFLQTAETSWESMKRLKAMEETTDGFKLSELDLKMRWSWEMLGIRQSGETDIPPDILGDIKFLQTVQNASVWLLEKYPNFQWIEKVKNFVQWDWNNILV